MHRIFRAAIYAGLFAAACALPGPAAAGEALVPGFDDLPVMSGLDPLNDGNVRFDAPGGRIVVAYLRGTTSFANIISFYGSTLEQLGWSRRSSGEYQREGEVLRIERLADQPQTVIRFTLAPAR